MSLKHIFAVCAALGCGSALAAAPTCPTAGVSTAQEKAVTERAVQWAEAQAAAALHIGQPLPARLESIARGSGVMLPHKIRLVIVDEIPLPQEQPLAGAAAKLGLSSSWAAGLTLGYAVIVARGYEADNRLLSHEFRHVAQYETCGGIPRFLAVHLADMMEHGYEHSRFEADARAHERP